jgi:hypothetical protein
LAPFMKEQCQRVISLHFIGIESSFWNNACLDYNSLTLDRSHWNFIYIYQTSFYILNTVCFFKKQRKRLNSLCYIKTMTCPYDDMTNVYSLFW